MNTQLAGATPDPASVRPTIYAIDFGTSNSLLAAVGPGGISPPVPLDPTSREPSILRSILFFSEQSEWFFGAEALSEYVAQGLRGRFIRSVKRFLPMRSFADTQIGTRRVRLEELVGVFLREMRERANRHFDADVRRVLLGRPARFSSDPEADQLAQDRLERAARFAGFEEIHFCPEPVAAAYDFRRRVKEETTLVVADLGGGTSDFTVAKLLPSVASGVGLDVLSIGGVSIAGDVLDGTIMRNKIARHFGAGVTYRAPFGKNVLTMPKSLVERLCSPAELCLLSRRDVLDFLRDVKSLSLGPEDKAVMDQLLCLIEDALGFRIFESIEITKRSLSDADSATFEFEYADLDIHEEVRRSEFEAYIAPHVDELMACLTETLSASGVTAAEVDLVCSTGGTARIPLIARNLEARFGHSKMHQLSSFHSVIQGLGERAQALID